MKGKVLLLFILALVTLVVVGWLGRNAINRSIQSVEQASAPNQKLLLIRELFQELLDAESSVRTYTITDNRNALNSFAEASANVEMKLAELEEAVQNTQQDAILQNLDSLTDRKFETLRQLIRINDEGNDSTVLDKIRADIETLRNQNTPEQLSTIRDLYLKEENNDQDYEKLFGDTRESAPDSAFDGSVKQDLSSRQLDDVLAELSRQEEEQSERRREQELQLTQFDSRIMNEIRNEVDQFESLEVAITRNETEELTNASQDAKTFISTIMIAGLLLFAVMLLIIFNDISRSIKNREKLRAAKDEAERLAMVKEEFLSNMSHEIRTPLNAVIGFTEQLTQSDLRGNQRSHVDKIQRSANHLQQLINDILDYAKLESGKMNLEQVGFRPDKHLRETVELFESQAREKNLELITKMGQFPEVVIGDPVRFSQLIINLVSNALKFTKEGGVTINLDSKELHDHRVSLILEVTDTGIGIAEEKLQHIFDDFAQADSSTTREFGGTGLGLSIVRKIVNACQGQLDVVSKPGSGTTFSILLPFTVGSESDLPQTSARVGINLDNKRILVVDDQEFNRELVETILTKLGADVSTCEDGREAVDELKNAAYDLVLMDIQMPGLSGLEAAQEIRSGEGPNTSIPIVALTAGSSEKEKQAIEAAGMDDLLLKPFSQNELLKILAKHLQVNVEQETQPGLVPDLTDLMELANGDESFVVNMLQIFINNSKSDLSELQKALAQDDRQRVKALAHKMIPPCRHLGFDEVVEILQNLESISVEKDKASLRESVENVTGLLESLYPGIEKELRKLTQQQASSSL